ncbi:MAG: hypothetical protein ACREDS_10600, partial [Limisphaerales bacterium]
SSRDQMEVCAGFESESGIGGALSILNLLFCEPMQNDAIMPFVQHSMANQATSESSLLSGAR